MEGEKKYIESIYQIETINSHQFKIDRLCNHRPSYLMVNITHIETQNERKLNEMTK